jgi:hypothetical protein
MLRLILASAVIAGLAGCAGRSGECPVSGSVSLDGQPLTEGSILFVAVDNQVTAAGGTIENGQFAFKVLPGVKRVLIHASKQVPGQGARGEQYISVSIIPECYNAQTTLQADVACDRINQFDYQLTSKQ